jgi:tRNA pseudouridine55 synthase
MGTLDPFATGLLVLLVGRVTRLAPYLQGEPKVYDATIRFGRQTDTDDGTGREIAAAPLPDARTVEEVLPTLTGTFEQMPPAFSAKQVDGVRAYDAARRGAAIALKPSVVTVHGWCVHGWRAPGELDVTVTCGGGTYIRALARDLGTLSGSAAHLSALRRTRSGPYTVDEAIPLDQLESGVELRSPLEGLSELSAVAVTGDEKARIARGQSIGADALSAEWPNTHRAVLVDENRQIVAIAERQASSWAPRVVLIDG